MSYDHYIGEIDDESVWVECGPMRLVIRAWQKRQPQLKPARQAAEASILYLERIARNRPLLSRPIPQIEDLPQDELAHRMVTSARVIGDADLTPMAAVAGTLADVVADRLFDQGMTRVIVDNGGDIAVRLAEDEAVTVGVRPQIASRHISHMIRLDCAHSSWGVTTSGLGGRSLSRGIASAVTVLATNASVADAAATAIANACYVKDDRIIQVPAETIDPNSDLTGVHVTREVGSLSSGKIQSAIQRARQKADDLAGKDIIVGAFIALAGVYAMTDGMRRYALPVKSPLAE